MKLDRLTPDWLAIMPDGIVLQADLFKPQARTLSAIAEHRERLHSRIQQALGQPRVRQLIDRQDEIGVRFALDTELGKVINWELQKHFDYRYVTVMHHFDLASDKLSLVLIEPDTQEVLMTYKMKRH